MNQPTEVSTDEQSQITTVPADMNLSGSLMETLLERAMRYPRDIKRVKESAWAELEFVPELAARSYYSIPYNQGKQNETRVEGPSIKAAMTLARNWGNCFNQGRIHTEEKSAFIVQGVFIDLQTNSQMIREIRVSKFYKPRGGQGVVPLNADMLRNAIQAGISKAVRNATLAALPDWLVQGYFNYAKHLVVNPPKGTEQATLSLQDRILKGKQMLAKTFKINVADIENYIADNAEQFVDDASLLIHLQGLYSSFSEGHVNPGEVFGPKKVMEAGAMPEEK